MSAIPVIEFHDRRISVGYTDYSAVYISSAVVGAQRATLLKHEKGHIWLQHQSRKLAFTKTLDKIDHKLWNLAADLEIAKHLYTAKDEEAIGEPRSHLAGGITKSHCETYPDATYAEEFYHALLNDDNGKSLASHDGEMNDLACEAGGGQDGQAAQDGQAPADISEVVKEALEQAAKDALEQAAAAALAQQQYSVSGFTPPKPSLSSLLDRHLGRSKVEPKRSYARPSRRLSTSDLILKGSKCKPMAPKLAVYVDRSGSFCPDKTADSLLALNECLVKYRGRVEFDVVYFADKLMLKDPGRGVGGTNYQPVVDLIAKDRAEVSVIITDADSADGVKVPKDMPAVVVVPIACDVTSIGQVLNVAHAPRS